MLALLLGSSLFGCIAIKPTVTLVKTNQAVKEAEAAGAADAAPYEYTMATQYQRKAREEWGGSEFEECEALAGTAYKYALQAEEIARYGAVDVDVQKMDMMEELESDLEGVEDQ
ncbi:MAG: DUF4398 domain-containing protein [Myxococcota bacterium]|nr:DUF4398 domain-containing protein [Myxococcota bacterium]